MTKTLHDKLSEALKDVKIGDDSAFDLVKGYYDSAEAKDKVQKANDDLVAKRDAHEAEIKELKDSIAEKDTSLSDKDSEIIKLKESSLSEEERKSFLEMQKTGMSKDMEATFNKLRADIDGLNTKLAESEKANQEAAETAKNATRAEKMATYKTQIKSALGDAGINGSNAELALLKLEADGLFKIKEKDGAFETKAFVKNDKGEMLDATLKNLADDTAKRYENLVSPSGNTGSGQDHQNGNPGNGGKSAETINQVRSEARDMLTMT